ncbi:unnamed protein product, partial [Arabidopsis halleri]
MATNKNTIDGRNNDDSFDDGTVGGGALGKGLMPSAVSAGLMPEKFGGNGFKTWQQKMHFFLTTLNLDKYLKEDAPVLPPENTDPLVLASVDSWTHTDFLCKGWILRRLVDPLYAVYSKVNTSKDLWGALEKKYMSEDAGLQKYATANFLNFKMVNSKPIMEQVEALQLSICEIFTVNCFLRNFPQVGWIFRTISSTRKKQFRSKTWRAKLVESRNRNADDVLFRENNVNMAEHKKSKGKNTIPPQASSSFKKQTVAKKFSGKCHKCGKMGHKANACTKVGPSKDNGKSQANLTQDDLCAVVTEVNTVEDNPLEWWYDTGATTHICVDKDMFCSYQKCKSEERLLMGNTGSSKIEGYGKVVLKMTSEREITLQNVKHVPDMRKNLISGTLMSKAGFAVIFESDKLVLKKHGVYVGKG